MQALSDAEGNFAIEVPRSNASQTVDVYFSKGSDFVFQIYNDFEMELSQDVDLGDIWLESFEEHDFDDVYVYGQIFDVNGNEIENGTRIQVAAYNKKSSSSTAGTEYNDGYYQSFPAYGEGTVLYMSVQDDSGQVLFSYYTTIDLSDDFEWNIQEPGSGMTSVHVSGTAGDEYSAYMRFGKYQEVELVNSTFSGSSADHTFYNPDGHQVQWQYYRSADDIPSSGATTEYNAYFPLAALTSNVSLGDLAIEQANSTLDGSSFAWDEDSSSITFDEVGGTDGYLLVARSDNAYGRINSTSGNVNIPTSIMTILNSNSGWEFFTASLNSDSDLGISEHIQINSFAYILDPSFNFLLFYESEYITGLIP